MRRVAVDANVFVSFFIDRQAGQHAAARADAVIAAVARDTRCDAVATFDKKLANKLPAFGLTASF